MSVEFHDDPVLVGDDFAGYFDEFLKQGFIFRDTIKWVQSFCKRLIERTGDDGEL